MTTLTLTPDPSSGTIALEFDNVFGMTSILRADANGTRPVRLRSGDLPRNTRETFIDHEAALTGRIFYRCQGVEAEAWTELGAELPRFTLPAAPSFSIEADTVHGYSAARESLSIFHNIIGRGSPAVAEGPLKTRTGTLDVWFAEYAQARDLENMLGRGAVMYRQAENPGQDMYFHAASVTVDPDEDAWKLTANYIEVDFPPGEIAVPRTWDFEDLAADVASFDAVRTGYGTFHDLAAGDPT